MSYGTVVKRCTTCSLNALDGVCPKYPTRHADRLRWSALIDLPTTDGKRRQSRRIFDTRTEAESWLASVRVETDRGDYITPSKLTFAEFIQGTPTRTGWLDHIETETLPKSGKTRRPTTIQNYRDLVGYVLPSLGNRSLQSISRETLEQTYRDLHNHGARDGSPLSNNTIARIGAVVRLALAEAEKRRLVRTNVANGATVPGREEVDGGIAYWTEEELGRFWKYIGTDSDLFPVLYTAAWTGLRRGELLALRWGDVDLAEGSVWVRQARKAVNGRVVEGPPKTHRGVRQVPFLNSSLSGVLASWKQRQVASVQGYVFTDYLGQPLDPGAVTKRFRVLVLEAVEALGLPYITLHGLRHSFATTVLGWGVEPFKVSRILGHANISITLDLYNEYLPSRDDELRGMFIDRMMGG